MNIIVKKENDVQLISKRKVKRTNNGKNKTAITKDRNSRLYMHIWSLGPIHTFFDCNNKLASTSLKLVLPYITSALFHVCTFAIKWLTRLYPL